MKPKIIEGGFQLLILNGVMWINSSEGSILRITGMPKDMHVDESVEKGHVIESMNGT